MARMPDLGRIPGTAVIPNCVEVDLLWTLASTKPVRNILHGSVGGGFSATAAIAQAVFAASTTGASWTAYAAFLHTTVTFTGIQIKDLRGPNNPYVVSTGVAVAGTGAGVALPAGVSVVASLKTVQAGRHNRGRIYLPGLDSATLVPATGLFLGTFQTAAQNFIALLQSAMTASGITHVIAQPARQQYTGRKGAIHLATPASVQPVTSVVARLQPFEQRRRNLVA